MKNLQTKTNIEITILVQPCRSVQTSINLSICIDLNTDWNYIEKCNRAVTPEAHLQRAYRAGFASYRDKLS